MFKQEQNKYGKQSSYGQNFQKRPISAKNDANLKNIEENVDKQFKYLDFMKNLQQKLVHHSPKQEKQKFADFQLQVQKEKQNLRTQSGKNLQTSYGKINLDDFRMKNYNSPNAKENDKNIINRLQEKNIANRLQEKNKYYTNVLQKQQEKINQSTQNDFYKNKNQNNANQSMDQKQLQPDFKKLQNKMSNLESKIQQIKINHSVEKQSYNQKRKQMEQNHIPESKVVHNLKQQIQSYFKKKENSPQKLNESKQNLSINTSKNQSIQKLNDFVTSVQKNSPNNSSSNIIQKINLSIQQQSLKKQKNSNHSKNSNHKNHIFYISNAIAAFQNVIDKNQYTRDHFMQSIQSMNFCKNFKQPTQHQINQKKQILSKKNMHIGKKTLIFDLDETLIHCNDSNNVKSDVTLPIHFPTGEVIHAGINIRPYAFQILKEMSKIYEIMIFTASHSCYANVVLDHLDPNNQYIQHRLYRESCIQTEEGVYVKDLRVINRDMKDMILIDNACYSFAFQVDNGVPILNFYENKNDKELLDLIDYLGKLNECKDVREYNKKMLKLKQFQAFQHPIELIQTLFNQQLK